jgi:2-(1,2-epoxy-1,2-dihydrophenyl)acetyl-CoA isomerase
MSASNLVRTELDGNVLTIILDHPKANAFNDEMVDALQYALKQAARDSQTRCLVLTGSGRFFSTGRDLNDVNLEVEESFRQHLLGTFNPLVVQIRQLEKPVIAAINGTVAGAALGMALACDLRIASMEARFVVGFLGIGLGPDSGVSLFLPLLVGLGRATELAFSNKPLNAQQALEWGLVNRLAPEEDLGAQAAAWAAEVAQGPERAMGLAKRAFNRAVLGDLEQALDYEAHIQDIAGRGAEYREGVSAFLEKRPPKFV